jgi:IclR family acetate operon transcriptional repressor
MAKESRPALHPEAGGLRASLKTLAVLSRLGASPDGITLSELAEGLGLAPSTVHRLLRDLMESDFAVQDLVSKRYWVGPEIERMARTRPSHALLKAVARPFLENVVRRTGETAFLSVLHGSAVLSIDCVLSERRLRMWGEPGARGPLHATSQGKAMLAQLPPETLDRVLDAITLEAYTSHTLTQRDQLVQELAVTRERGYATNNQERDEGVVSIAVPLDAGNGLIGATSIAAPLQRLPLEELVAAHGDFMRDGARSISARMAASSDSDGRVPAAG